MYKQIVKEIQNLPWSTYEPKEIIFLSLATAIEFAASLRVACLCYPSNANLKEMAAGELKTDNLSYGDYAMKGDHWQFLYHFCKKANFNIVNSTVGDKPYSAKKEYNLSIRTIGRGAIKNNQARAMTIFSREKELSGIFRQILASHDWEVLGYGFYKYYLERHIELDEADGGYADLTQEFDLDEEVLQEFYGMRLKLYQSLAA